MSRFDILATPLAGLHVLQRRPLRDERGYFERLFCTSELATVIGERRVRQINHTSTSKRAAVRGLHFQWPPHGEMKLISCLRGEVYDVAVDLRRDSATFLQWHAEILSADNHRTLAIPEGFAHGFQALCDDCEMLYLHTADYVPGSEGALNARDPRLAIQWPLPIGEQSPRDAAHPMLSKEFFGVVL